MTDPEMADVTYIEPITWQVVEKIIAKERPDAVLPTMGGQTALNCALDLHKHGVLQKYGVEMIGANEKAIEKAEDRAQVQGRDDRHRPGVGEVGHRPLARGGARGAAPHHDRDRRQRLSDGRPAQLHARRHRRRHRLQRRRVRGDLQARPRPLADQRAADRGEPDRLEGVRDGGRPRQGGQLHHRLLDREPRSDGHPHRRLDHGRAGADAVGQGIPADAQRVDRDPARDRRRDRRLERAVRGQPEGRPDGRHRDEPARLALLGAGVEGDRLSDRQGRRQAGDRLHARRAAGTTSPAARRRRASSRRSTTSSPRSRASRSRSSRPPTRA